MCPDSRFLSLVRCTANASETNFSCSSSSPGLPLSSPARVLHSDSLSEKLIVGRIGFPRSQVPRYGRVAALSFLRHHCWRSLIIYSIVSPIPASKQSIRESVCPPIVGLCHQFFGSREFTSWASETNNIPAVPSLGNQTWKLSDSVATSPRLRSVTQDTLSFVLDRVDRHNMFHVHYLASTSSPLKSCLGLLDTSRRRSLMCTSGLPLSFA